MPLALPSGYCAASYRMSLAGDADPYYVTHAWSIDVGTPPSQALANGIIDAFISAMDDGAPSAVTFTGGTVRFGPAPTGPTFDVSRSVAGLAGTSALSPPNCAKLVQKRTEFGGRAFRGRLYLPFVVEVNVDNLGDMTTAYRDAEQNRVTTWITSTVTVAGVDAPMLLHNNPAIPPTLVIAHTVQTRIATQRRRLR